MSRSYSRFLYVIGGVGAVVCSFVVALQWLTPSRAQQNSEVQAPNTAPVNDNSALGASSIPGEAGLSELEGFLEPFIYDVVNRRDPFVPYSDFVPTNNSLSHPLTPAQRFDLDQLQLVGIMWDTKDPKAMFLDPDKEVLVLGREDGVGNRNGYIAAIREGEVVVVEAQRRRGEVVYKTKVLRIER